MQVFRDHNVIRELAGRDRPFYVLLVRVVGTIRTGMSMILPLYPASSQPITSVPDNGERQLHVDGGAHVGRW